MTDSTDSRNSISPEPQDTGSSDSHPVPQPSPEAGARAAYYDRWFGKPSMFWEEDEVESPPVHILVYPPSPAHDRDFYTLITSGMSDAEMPLPDDVDPRLSRSELMMYILPSDLPEEPRHVPWFVSVLHSIAHMPWRFQTWFGESHTIPNGNPPSPFIKDSSLTTALLLPPIFEPREFAEEFTLDSNPVNFYWVTFLTDDECAFKLENGYEALMKKFEDVNFPHILDVSRKSVLS